MWQLICTTTTRLQDIDTVIPMYNMLEDSNNYQKKNKQEVHLNNYRDEPGFDNTCTIINFTNYYNTDLFKFK